uniref:EamA domain-containing protein n=1 Tax=Pseudo-nitzschia australis TaxID=44445 RepID=A0A7S4ABI5_9STRA
MNRFKWWTILLFSSGLVWWAAAIKFYEDDEAFGKQDIVVLSLYTPSILFSLGGLLTSMCFKGKTKTLTETILIFANLINWIMIAIATLVDVDTHLKGLSDLVVGTNDNNSYEGGRDIKEPNIYFFSFGSLFISVYLTSSWVKQYILRDENALTTTQWMLLATSGFLVMIAGCSQLQTASCGNDDEYGCSRVIFSICNGLLSGVTSCLLVPWRSAPLKCQGEFAMILLISWAAAIPILTFKSGPAVDINTMYFGIYISFHLALNILSTTAHADALLEASAYSQVQFDMTETEKAEDELGAAGFLDFAYANLTHPQAVDPADDLRNADPSEAMLFEPVKVYSSVDGLVQNSWRESQFNRKVILGKHDSERIQIWFCLLVESSVCIAVFYDVMDKSESFADQWIVLAPVLSVILCTIGWVTSLVQKKCARMAEGVLVCSKKKCSTIWPNSSCFISIYFECTHILLNSRDFFANLNMYT